MGASDRPRLKIHGMQFPLLLLSFAFGAVGHEELSCLQSKTEIQRKSGVEENRSARIVAITYCDSGFADIWPVFVKCYERALSCSVSGRGEACTGSKPQLLELGLDFPEPADVRADGTEEEHRGRDPASARCVSAARSRVGRVLQLAGSHWALAANR